MDHLSVAMSLIGGRPLTDDVLTEVLGQLSQLDKGLSPEGLKGVKGQLESTFGVRVSVGEVLNNDDREPWLSDAKGSITWHYWDSYAKLLRAQGWSPDVVQVLNKDTDNIVTECGNPNEGGAWNVRGLVMGDVQSGKTASYSGVIAKAADAGYRVIVLLTGVIEDLRKQTQERLDTNFVGRDSREALQNRRDGIAIGAGAYRNRAKSASALTSVDFDFLLRNAATFAGIPLANMSNEPLLFVMKKNKAPLENLCQWLDSQLVLSGVDKLEVPLLIVDDEADNASVNVRRAGEEPATINRLIRQMIDKFARSSYVGYTATPFANVFIDPDDQKDLFPKDFIYSLNTPSHYIGAASIFLDDGKYNNQIRDIADAEPCFPLKHDKSLHASALPESLKEAVRQFILTCAIRDIRSEAMKHRSMLVNVSRFTDVQKRIAQVLESYLWEVQEEVKQYLKGRAWKSHSILAEIEATWAAEFSICGTSWEEIRSTLYESIASVRVVTVNQKSEAEEKLDYSRYKNTAKGRRVIAVGGLTLSRGITLEGLAVSYFYRNSKAYDTLLQMGRWFGYRQGYDDLFRIWMDTEAQGWYAHIAGAVAELRTDFRRMSVNRLPPSKFGIRVKSDPNTLIVTAQNKMRHGEEVIHRVSFSAFGAETPFLHAEPHLHDQNLARLSSFLRTLDNATRVREKYFWSGVNRRQVAAFLSDLNINPRNIQFLPDSETGGRPICEFIAKNSYRSLEEWDVCIPQGEGSIVEGLSVMVSDSENNLIKCRKRQFERTSTPSYLKLNKQRVGQASDERVGMSDIEIAKAKAAWEIELEKDKSRGKDTPGYIFRRFRSRPLLTIHLIESTDPKTEHLGRMLSRDEVGKNQFVAVSVSFPDFDPNAEGTTVTYRLNKIALRELLGDEEDDDGED